MVDEKTTTLSESQLSNYEKKELYHSFKKNNMEDLAVMYKAGLDISPMNLMHVTNHKEENHKSLKIVISF